MQLNNQGERHRSIMAIASASAPNLSESISYDVMGNITSLTRDGYGTNNYHTYDGNKLMGINGFTNSPYNYDANGNMNYDSGKGISIGYNVLNLPQTISGSQNITYTYDATGSKLKKQSSTTGTTDYVKGIQYTNGSIEFVQTEEGLARNNGGNYSYEYNLKDHLGNTRATFHRDPNTGSIDILQRDNYYAFGLRQAVNGGTNKYLYNGKELQEELNQYDYVARFYDPVVGRFNSIDPLAEKSRRFSPYVYANNNPIRFIDPDGMETTDWIMGADKKPKFDIKVTSSTDKDLKKGDTYIGKTAEYKATNGGEVQLNADGSWNYTNQTALQKPNGDEPQPSTQGESQLPTLSKDNKEALGAAGIANDAAKAATLIAKAEPTAMQTLVSSTSKVLGATGTALGLASLANDGLTIYNKGSKATYADWAKLGISTGMVFMKTNPYTLGFSIAYGVASMAGYNPVDIIYNETK